MPNKTEYSTGQRVFLLAEAEHGGWLYAEDFNGISDRYFRGTVLSRYGNDHYVVLTDAGDRKLVHEDDLEPIEDRSEPNRFDASIIFVLLLGLVGYLIILGLGAAH